MGCTRPEQEQVKIGVILPLTGPLGYLGEEERKAIEIAEENINKTNKLLKVIFEDSMGSPSRAVTVANRLIEIDNVDAIITATTSVSKAVLPIADRNKKIIGTLCMDPTIQSESPFAYRLYESMGQEANVLLDYYSLKRNKTKKVGILYVNHAGTVQQLEDFFVPGFKNMDIEIFYKEPYELTDKDFRVKINKIKKSEIDSLIIIGYGFKYSTIFEQLAQYGLIDKIEITGGWGFIAPSKISVDFLENIIVATPKYVFKKNKEAKIFEEQYNKKFKNLPNFDAAFAYDAIRIIADALIKANGNIEKGREILSAMRAYNGIMGQIKINEDGGIEVPMGLGIIKSGKIVPLE